MTLTIDTAAKALTLAEAAALLPGRPHIETVRRWCLKGLAGGVRLEYFRSGGKLFTTRPAIEAFLAAQNGYDPAEPRRQRDAADALSSMGV